MTEESQITFLIVGAGVIGLAIGAKLSKFGSCIVVDKNPKIGEETSSRNSEVIHAGIYYPENSLKTKLCIAGRHELYNLCDRYSLAYKKLGKWIIACNEKEFDYLEKIKRKTDDLEIKTNFLTKKEIANEPNVLAKEVLYSPQTGILDSHSFMAFLRAEIENNGGDVITHSSVLNIEHSSKGFSSHFDGFKLESKFLINAAGLFSNQITKMLMPLPKSYHQYLCKGIYYGYSGKSLVKRLIYPVPEKNLKGLGVHATLDLGGQMRFGPDAEYIDHIDYNISEDKLNAIHQAVCRYLKGIHPQKLKADYAGIRPKLSAPGESFRDFLIEEESNNGLDGFINLAGIESPGLTASLAIANLCAKKLGFST